LHQPPVGADLVLTIDVDVQRAAAAALGDRAGAVVALDPRTGEVLALVSQPTYDPGRLEAEWERIREDPSHPLVNRATSGLYPPGSTFKVVTAAAAVELGKVDLQERFPCQEGVVVEGWHLPCKSPPQPPTLTFAQALAWSSNPVFARVGLDLASPTPIDLGDDAPRPYWWETHGVLDSFEVLRAYAERFGIGSSIPFDLPTEDGQIIASDEPTPVLVAATAFGQGELLVTPLHMVLVAATVANDGLVPQPYLVAEIRQPNGVTLHPHRPGEGQRRAIKPETAAVLRDMMRLGVTEGWARTAALPNVAVAGKTGTAEVGGGADHHAWFIGFAPYEAPRVAVAVVVEHGGDGTAVAGPIAREVLAAALRRPDTREGAAAEAERNLERPTPAPPAEVVEPEPTPQPTGRPVRRVRVGNTDGMGVYIRRTPNLDDKLRAWPDGTVLEVVGEEVEQNGVRWRRVRDPAGNTGWVPIQYTIPEE
jgi:peptidoglycan glycosyltransferase